MRNFLFLAIILGCCTPKDKTSFPQELVNFIPYEKNPVFTGTGTNTWDSLIRERGFILREVDGYHLWYSGYAPSSADPTIYLGYATSPDGLTWTRYSDGPVFSGSWTEDMMVVKHDSLYYMFAEGKNDLAHLLTSSDKVNWKDHGTLLVRYTNGQPLSEGPFGTPAVMIEDKKWYLFYERNDSAVWLASSTNLKVWTNVQDEPVLKKGPGLYDKFAVAANQVIKYEGSYYMYYHGTPFEDWSVWNTNVAVSTDLLKWEKYEGNPVMEEDKSSGILVDDGTGYRLYTMHPKVCVHFKR